MKDFRGMKRQRNRNRKPSGNQNNPNRAYESNGPEGTKARGNAQTIYEKYQQLARDANSAGDRVLAENHLQHAEHYFRMIRQMQPQRPVSEFVQRDPFSNGFDVDYDDDYEGEGGETAMEAPAAEAQGQSDEQPRFDNRNNNRDGRDRDNRDRDNRERDNRDRDNRDRDNRNRNDRQNRDNRNFNGEARSYTAEPRPMFVPEPRPFNPEQRTFEPRGDDGDMDGGRRETRRERYERRRAQRLVEQEQDLNGIAPVLPSTGHIASTEPLAVANGRHSRPSELAPAPAAEQPVLRDAPPMRERRERAPRPERAERPERNDSDHLPAFIRTPAPIAAAEPAPTDAEPAKPKRGRKPKVADVGAAEEA